MRSNFDSSVGLEDKMAPEWSSTLNSHRGETDKKREGGREGGRERWAYFILDSVDDGEGERDPSPGEEARRASERSRRLGAHVNM